jgi:uncharacterized protein (DUF433 family)
MTQQSLITSDPRILCGKPCITGTRISVELILGWLAMDWNMSQILEAYPHITRQQVLAAIDYARSIVKEEGYLPMMELAA